MSPEAKKVHDFSYSRAKEKLSEFKWTLGDLESTSSLAAERVMIDLQRSRTKENLFSSIVPFLGQVSPKIGK